MHEAVLKNIFSDDRRTFRLRRERHVLRLHVGGEAGVLFGDYIGAPEIAIRLDAN